MVGSIWLNHAVRACHGCRQCASRADPGADLKSAGRPDRSLEAPRKTKVSSGESTLAQPTKLTPSHTIDGVSGSVLVVLIWCVLGLPIAVALTRHWQTVHRRWLLAVAERESGTSLRTDGRLKPRRLYWELRASTKRGFGSRILQHDANPDIEALRQESVAAFREVRMRFALFLTLWLALGLAMLIALR